MAQAMKDDSARAARRRKIKQLEASLFGGGGGGGDGSAGTGGVTTGLPELQRVGEYSLEFGKAERKKSSGLPKLRKIKTPAERRPLFPSSKFGPGSRSDEEELLDSSGGSGSLRTTPPCLSDPIPPPALPLPPPTAQSTRVVDAVIMRRRRSSLGGGQTAQNLLRSEVEQLDDSIRHLVKDPKLEVLENMKRRHGISKSPSMQEQGNGLYTFPHQGSLTNVSGVPESPLGHAALLERRRSQTTTPSSGRRTVSMDRTSQLLEQEQEDLEKTMWKLDSRFSEGGTTNNTVDYASAGQSQDFQWPTMPDIKPQALPVTAARRESLQPLTLSASSQSKQRTKGQRIPTSPGLQAPPSASDPTSVSPFDEKFNRASKLPAIGRVPSIPSASVPSIKINTSPRPRRDPQKEKTVHDSSTLREPTTPQSPNRSLVNFEHLEMLGPTTPGATFENMGDTLSDIPTNTLENMSTNTFDEIPTNVFDAIPTAIVERERRRREHREKSAVVVGDAGFNQGSNRGGSSSRRLISPPLSGQSTPAPSSQDLGLTPAADIFMTGRIHQDEVMLSNGTPTVEFGAVSLLTALFPNAVARGGGVGGGDPDAEQVESDFVFALFIQEQEQATSNAPNVMPPDRSSRRRHSTAIAPPPPVAPDPPPLRSNNMAATDEEDPNEIGHFCAPFCPGFCEANFCVLHTPKTEQEADT
jgi:hypothetical protein